MKRAIALALTLSAAGVSNAGLEDLDFKTGVRGEYVLGVAALDQREFVRSGESPPKIVGGYIKGMFRTRAHTYTNSEQPVSDAISEGLRKAFVSQNWLGVTTLKTNPMAQRADLDPLIKKAGLKRVALITVDDLWTESYRNTSVNYKFTVSILDGSANTLASATHSGVHDTREWGDDAAGEIFSKLLNETMQKPDFVKALAIPAP